MLWLEKSTLTYESNTFSKAEGKYSKIKARRNYSHAQLIRHDHKVAEIKLTQYPFSALAGNKTSHDASM